LAGNVLLPSAYANEEHCHGFHTSQFIDCNLDPNPYAAGDRTAPPLKLAIGFSTGDVLILGWHFGRLADLPRENDLATVHVLSKRYADLDRTKPFIASITVTPIDGDGDSAIGRNGLWKAGELG
jgi:hypothetical protein